MINHEAFFRVSYGLYIVSAGDKSVMNGFISNSVFQITAEPPQFAVCCNKENYTAEIIRNSGYFSISVLNRDADSRLIGKFGYKSGKNISKFENLRYKTDESGIPIVLEDTVSWIACKLKDIFDVGTHLIFTGEVLHAEVTDEEAEVLTYSYYKNIKKGFSPKNAPTYIERSKLKNKDSMDKSLQKYECPECGYIYDPAVGDPEGGIKAGTAFEDLPEDWVCPECGTGKKEFVKFKEE